MEDKENRIEYDIADAIIDRPKGFEIGSRHFYLYPVTLGKAYLTQRIMELLDVNSDNMKLQPMLESLRIVKENRDNVALLLTYYTLQKKEELLSQWHVTRRKNYFKKELSDSDMATLFIMAATWDNTANIMHHFKIDEEQDRMHDVLSAKDTRNTFSFGAKTIYGSIIDAACERYGWTYDYVVWGISYTNLRLMLADRQTSVYLSEEEAKRVHVSNPQTTINGDDAEQVKDYVRGRSWK